MLDLWTHALSSIGDRGTATLVVVVDHTGSVPGTTGATMVVAEKGCRGTVGGGVAEHETIERARSFTGPPELIEIQHTPDASGSLCSGTHTLALHALTGEDRPILESIVATLEHDRVGALRLSGEGMMFEPDRVAPAELVRTGTSWRFEMTLGRIDTLYIFGGGHVALALSRVIATLPFRIVVLDDRPDLPTMAANSYAHETRVVDYRAADKEVVEGARSWVVVMTYGHQHDELVLRRLLGQELRYLGLLGSVAKVRRMFARMRADGVPQDRLDRITAPVGLAIGSHTPEEIAISIAAEIVQLRNRSE